MGHKLSRSFSVSFFAAILVGSALLGALTASAEVSTARSTISSIPGAVTADGFASAVIEVTVRDEAGNPLSGQTVILNQNAGAHSSIAPAYTLAMQNGAAVGVVADPLSAVTNANGVAAFAVRNDWAEKVTYSASVIGGPSLSGSVEVEFALMLNQQALTAGAIITPNSTYTAGANAVLIEGDDTAMHISDIIATNSGHEVQAVWVLSGGMWTYFLPRYPEINGGIGAFAGLSSAIVILA